MSMSELAVDDGHARSAEEKPGRSAARMDGTPGSSLGWIVLAGIVHRTTSIPVGIAIGVTILGHNAVLAVGVGSVVMIANAVLAFAIAKGRFGGMLSSRAFFAIDVSFVFALNYWAGTLVPDGEFLRQGADVFHLYTLGTIVAWTGLRGYRTAISIIGCVAAIELVTVITTHSHLALSGILQLLSRVGWLTAGMAVPLVIMLFARRATALADERARAAGTAVERAHALRSTHDTVLQTFGHIARRCVMRGDQSAEYRLQEISHIARDRATQMRELLLNDDKRSIGSLTDGLNGLMQEFERHGLEIELQVQGPAASLSLSSTRALIGATTEALTNVLKHAGAGFTLIVVSYQVDTVHVEIIDSGRGFDPGRQDGGYGIEHSILGRLRDAGGMAEVSSCPGQGTTVRMVAPRCNDEGRLDGDLDPTASIALGDNQRVSAEELTSEALNWFAIPAMAYRVCISPLQAIIALATVDMGLSAPFAYVMVVVLAADTVVLVGLIAGRFKRLLQSNLYLAVDVSVAVALNVWASAELPANTVLLPGREVFWGYAIGVLAFWTGLRGARTGIAMVIGGSLLQLVMVVANRASLLPIGWTQLLAQGGLLVMTLVVVWMMTALARRGARQAVTAGVREGRAIERTRKWRSLYLGALGVLDLIVQRVAESRRPDVDRLHEIRGLALAESDKLRAMLAEPRDNPTNLTSELRRIREEFRRSGLRVELVTAELNAEPPPAMAHALNNAVREALSNVWRHADVVHVVVNAATRVGGGVEVTIRDHGRGFDPTTISSQSGIAKTIVEGMRKAGGSALVWSEPGSGTRIHLLAG